ncbi:MAG TPA: LamG-like jellyroll fold domain-containing protein, partial [Verrucomicrobiae bacterium]
MFRASFRKWRQWSAAGTAAAFLAVVTISVVRQRSAPVPLFQPPNATAPVAETVATLRHAADVQWVDVTNEIFLGDNFGAQRLRIASGVLQLEFKRGARLVMEGPADLQLISSNEAFLHSGRVTAHVPDQAHGFKITAPAVAVIDLGTEFGLHAATNGRTEMHVFSGAVEMQQLTTQPRRMTQGQAAQIRGKRIRHVSADRDGFVFEHEVTRRETEEHHARYRNWRIAAQALSTEPAAVIHYTFEDPSANARQLANHALAARPATAGAIVGCQWSEGRWPEKRAITFGNKSDRLRFHVPNTLTSLTYMVWLRIDKLVNLSNALAITESMQQGEVHWQVYRDGRVALSAHSGSGATVDQSWDRGLSPPIFTTERLGKWTHLVSVYDSLARTISHYVNGEFASATPIKRPLPIKLGAVEVANWGVQADQPTWASLK